MKLIISRMEAQAFYETTIYDDTTPYEISPYVRLLLYKATSSLMRLLLVRPGHQRDLTLRDTLCTTKRSSSA